MLLINIGTYKITQGHLKIV